jgi:hypothetical protein
MKILLAVDGSAYTKKMLAYLVTHEETFLGNNDYVLFTAQPALPSRARVALSKDVVDQYHRAEVERVLAPAAKFLLRHGIDAKSAWKMGPAGETIAQYAEAGKFDLLVPKPDRRLACAGQRAFRPSKQVDSTSSMISSSLCSPPICRNSSTGSQARAYSV